MRSFFILTAKLNKLLQEHLFQNKYQYGRLTDRQNTTQDSTTTGVEGTSSTLRDIE